MQNITKAVKEAFGKLKISKNQKKINLAVRHYVIFLYGKNIDTTGKKSNQCEHWKSAYLQQKRKDRNEDPTLLRKWDENFTTVEPQGVELSRRNQLNGTENNLHKRIKQRPQGWTGRDHSQQLSPEMQRRDELPVVNGLNRFLEPAD